MRPGLRLFFAALFVPATAALAALSPTRSQHAWVAGTGEAGNVDGAFMVARFDRPGGLLFDKAGQRLIVADTGNRSLRLIELGRKNTTTTLKLVDADSGASFVWQDPLSLAWKQEGKLAYCLDRKKPGVAVVDLDARTAKWLPLPISMTAKSGAAFFVANATSLHVIPGSFAVLATGAPDVFLAFDLPGGRSLACSVQGSPGPIVDLASDKDGLWAISREKGHLFRLLPVGAPANWADAFASAATSTASAPDWQADIEAGRGVDQPWAFVKGSNGLRLVSDSAALMVYRQPDASFQSWALRDQRGRRIGLENDEIYDESLKVLKTRSEYKDMVGTKRLFRRAAAAAEDAADDRWYLSETESHRIVSCSRTVPDTAEVGVVEDELFEQKIPVKKKPGVHRIGVFGTCYFKESKDTNRKMDTFTKRLQWHLNVLSSLRGGKAYEPVNFAATLSADASYTTHLKKLFPKAIGQYQVDEVMLAMRPRDFGAIVRGYQNFPIGADGIPQGGWDPEYGLSERRWEDVKVAPFQDLAAYVIPQIKAGKIRSMTGPYLGHINFMDAEYHWPPNLKNDYKDPVFIKKLFALVTYDLRIQKKQMEALAAAERRELKFSALLFPEHGTLGPQELYDAETYTGPLDLTRQAFAAMCKELGIRCIDLVDEMRVYGLDSPFVEVMDGHTTQNGNDLMGLVAAERYLEEER